MYSELTFYVDPLVGLECPPFPEWSPIGKAASASVKPWYGPDLHALGMRLVTARWQLTWDPRSDHNGVRLRAWDTFHPERQWVLGEAYPGPYANPSPGHGVQNGGAVLTAQLNNMIDTEVYLQIKQESLGDSNIGPLIHSSVIELLWWPPKP